MNSSNTTDSNPVTVTKQTRETKKASAAKISRMLGVLLLTFPLFALGCDNKEYRWVRTVIDVPLDVNVSVSGNSPDFHMEAIDVEDLDDVPDYAEVLDSWISKIEASMTVAETTTADSFKGRYTLEVNGGRTEVSEWFTVSASDWTVGQPQPVPFQSNGQTADALEEFRNAVYDITLNDNDQNSGALPEIGFEIEPIGGGFDAEFAVETDLRIQYRECKKVDPYGVLDISVEECDP